MTKGELRQELLALGVPEDAIELEGVARDECYVLEQVGSNWSVYYSERGLRSGERIFPSESEACEAMFRRVKRDFGG